MYLPDRINSSNLDSRVSSYKFAAIAACLLNFGVATQAMSVGDAVYMNQCLILSTICAVVSVLIYKVVLPKLNVYFKLYILIFLQVLIVVVLIVDDLFLDPYGAGSAINIAGSEYVLALLLIPIFILSIVTLTQLKMYKDWAIYFFALSILGFNALGLCIISELGTLLNLLFIFLIWGLLCFKSKKYFIVTLLLYVVFGTLGYQFLKLMYEHYAAEGVVNFITNIYEKVELRLFGYLDLYSSKYTDDDVYQMRKAREALAQASWFTGSSVNVSLPVYDSDLAFVYLCYKLGLVYGFLFMLLLVVLACYSRKLMDVECEFEKGVSTLFLYALVFQSIVTIGGSSAVAPLSGMPVLYLSMSGLYMAIVSTMLCIIISSKFIGNKTTSRRRT